MSAQESKNFIGTYAKVILSDWSSLVEIITKHTTYVKTTIQSEDQGYLIASLSDRQLKDALEGPLQVFFKQNISAFATLMRVQTELNLQKDEVFKEKAGQIPSENRLPAEKLFTLSLSDVEKCRKSLDQLVKQQDSEWDNIWNQIIDLFLHKFDEIEFPLSDIEIKEFMDREPISELRDRFVDLNLELPKLKNPQMTVEQYFILKAHLVVHSALSRQHKPHTDTDIKPILKSLRPVFNAIREGEQQLNDQQKQQTDEVIQQFEFARYK